MEVRYDRLAPNAATYAVTFFDAEGRLARREVYAAEEVNGRAAYLGGSDLIERDDLTPEEQAVAYERRAAYEARVAETRAVLGPVCPRSPSATSEEEDSEADAGGDGAWTEPAEPPGADPPADAGG